MIMVTSDDDIRKRDHTYFQKNIAYRDLIKIRFWADDLSIPVTACG